MWTTYKINKQELLNFIAEKHSVIINKVGACGILGPHTEESNEVWLSDGEEIEITVDVVSEDLATNDQLPEYVFGSHDGPARVKQSPMPAFRYSKK